ncbi:MAG: YchF family ATPase [Thermotogae bacterium]|nr:YchF family ATPase [Thermotogota bacterium]MCL5032595.1 YchF family ATPase [Thermotogota bacterium]
MKVGIYGAPFSGKTTVFKLLVGTDVNDEIGVAKVRDERVDFLSKMFNPKKTTYATTELVDLPGLSPELSRKDKNQILMKIQNVDAVLWIIRAFEDESVPKYFDDASKEVQYLRDELLVRDLEIAESNVEKLKNAKRKLSTVEETQLKALEKCLITLNDDKFAKLADLSDDEKKILNAFSLFTLLESVIVVNLDENAFRSHDYKGKEGVKKVAEENGFSMMEVCGKLEMEINDLEESERVEFLKDLGLTESGIQRLSKVLYSSLGLISFFTAGEDETKAWTIKRGLTFKEAAGKIHTDLERGFIRAEVVKFEDLKRLGSMKEIKTNGLMKLEGKDSIVEDGDIVNVRFSV